MKAFSVIVYPKMTHDTLQIFPLKTIFNMPHRAMFKLGGKKLFVLCLLVKNMSAVYSADR